MAFELEKLVRENIRTLHPYSSARDEFTGTADVFLDANENSFGSPLPQNYNRYPDSGSTKLKEKISGLIDIPADWIFLGNGSDEAIDLIFRIFCRPGVDRAIICPPTYGMYETSAAINDVIIDKVPLLEDFSIDLPAVTAAVTENTKLIFVCSPNNPTGNLIDRQTIRRLAEEFDGIVVIDEAYIHFADVPSLAEEINDLPNVVVLQTLSKAWGLAGLRIGLAIANSAIIRLLNNIKPPYNISQIAQDAAFNALGNRKQFEETVELIRIERAKLAQRLKNLGAVNTVFDSSANFLLVRFGDADSMYRYLLDRGIVTRNRTHELYCENCLRITVGTPEENDKLIDALKMYEESTVY